MPSVSPSMPAILPRCRQSKDYLPPVIMHMWMIWCSKLSLIHIFAELDEEGNTKEGGIQVEGAVMMPSYMKNDEQKAIFAGAKVNDVLVFNPNTEMCIRDRWYPE